MLTCSYGPCTFKHNYFSKNRFEPGGCVMIGLSCFLGKYSNSFMWVCCFKIITNI